MKHRLSYASVTATLALLLAVGGTSAVGAQALLTGRSVKDESLTGADIRNDSLTGADIREGSLGSNLFSSVARANLRGQTGPAGPKGETGATGATGATGPAGAGITSAIVTGPDVPDYQDMTPLATTTLPGAGDYVLFAHANVHNTGGFDNYMNCGLFVNGNAFGGGGAQVNAGMTADATAVGAMSLVEPTEVTFACMAQGSPNPTTFDLSDVRLRIHNLG